jgi:hypothetical protein
MSTEKISCCNSSSDKKEEESQLFFSHEGVDDGTESFLLLLSLQQTVFFNLNVEPGCVNALSSGGEMKPRLL